MYPSEHLSRVFMATDVAAVSMGEIGRRWGLLPDQAPRSTAYHSRSATASVAWATCR